MLRVVRWLLVATFFLLLLVVACPVRDASGEDATVQARVDRLIREIRDPGLTHEKRADSMRRLAYLGVRAAPAVPVLVRELDTGTQIEKEMSLFVLGMIGHGAKPAAEKLKKMYFSPIDEELKWAVGTALLLIGPETPPGVPLPDLRAEPEEGAPLADDPLRLAMIWLSGVTDDKYVEGAREVADLGPRAAAALPTLYRIAARTEKEAIRKAMREAIAAVEPPVNPLAKPPDVVPPAVREPLDDIGSPDATARWLAAMNLGRLGREAKAAVRALESALGDPEALVRLWAAASLGKVGPEAAPALPRLKELLANDPDPQVRRNAALAIERIGGRPVGRNEPVRRSLVGDWRGDFTTRLGRFTEIVSYLEGGTVEAVILGARGVRVWAGRGAYTYRKGIVYLDFAGDEPQKLPVKWISDDCHEITSKGITIRFRRMK